MIRLLLMVLLDLLNPWGWWKVDPMSGYHPEWTQPAHNPYPR